jgi:aminoglycoside 2'-N-acetyltransferase I
VNVRVVPTDHLAPDLIGKLKNLLVKSYGRFTVEDWDHALGGVHFFVEEDRHLLAHASVVERRLEVADTKLRAGYVEAVATRPDRRATGLSTVVVQAATDHIRASYELGGLCTGHNAFFERLGWETWRGPTFVRTDTGLVRTADEDGNVMILRTPTTPHIDPTDAISCDWRPGDVW